MAKKDGKLAEPLPGATAEAVMEEEEPNRLLEAARKVMLAYMGGVGVAWDEMEALIKRFVERGEVAEKDARKLLKELDSRRRSVGLDQRMEDLLHRMDIPTKSDIETLSANIATLTQKVEELKKRQPA